MPTTPGFDWFDVACVIIIAYLTLQRWRSTGKARPVEHFTASVPFLISPGGDGPDTLQEGQTLTASPLYYLNLVPGDTTSDLQVVDARTGTRVWGVTMTGRAKVVTVGEGSFFAKDAGGAILWSSPAPTGPNAGGPFKLALALTGVLQVTDKAGGVVFSTPLPRVTQPAKEAAVAPLREALIAAPALPDQFLLTATAARQKKQKPILLGPDFLIPTGPYGAPRFFYEEVI